ncbi:hypothetical protein X975_10721, partial [Stegodyphus mimosarum]
ITHLAHEQFEFYTTALDDVCITVHRCAFISMKVDQK